MPSNKVLPKAKAKPSDFTVVGFREFDFLGHKVELRVKTIFSEMKLNRIASKGENIEMYVDGTEASHQILSLDNDENGNVVIFNRETL